MKETYDNLALVIDLINYSKHEWEVCSDLKVVAIILGLQSRYTKYMCFLCLWDSRDRKSHYVRKDWPRRQNVVIGKNNVKNMPLVDPENFIPPPLHLKLGLIKNFAKRMGKDGPALLHLKKLFPKLSEAKIKEGVFNGPQIRTILKDQEFAGHLSSKEL